MERIKEKICQIGQWNRLKKENDSENNIFEVKNQVDSSCEMVKMLAKKEERLPVKMLTN